MMKKKLFLFVISLIIGVIGGGKSYAQKDVTSQYITNATLSNGTTGWTVSNFNDPQRGNNTVGYASECWAGNGATANPASYSMTQTITLPAGSYRLVNYSFYRQSWNATDDPSKSLAYLKAGNQQTAIKTLGSIEGVAGYANSQAEGANVFDAKMYRNFVEFTIDANDTPIEIGLIGTHDAPGSWVICGMFELFDLGQAASVSSPTDMTYAITNSGFEYRNLTGWVNSPDGAFWYMDNNNFGHIGKGWVEKWAATGTFPDASLSQTLTGLENGLYEVTVLAQARGGDGFYLYANNDKKAITDAGDYSVRTTVTDGNLTIKVGTESFAGDWTPVENFRLKFYGDPLAAYQALLDQAVEEAQTLINGSAGSSISTTAKAAWQAVVNDNDNDDRAFTQESDFTTAIANITTANTNYQAMASPYATWLKVKASANAMVAVPNNNAEATATLTTATSTQNTAAEAALTVAGLNTPISTLRTAIKTFINATEPTAGNKFEITCLIENPSFDNNTIDGWTRTYSGGAAQTQYTCNEFWNNTFDFYQNLTGLPNGSYQLSVQAFSRPGGNGNLTNDKQAYYNYTQGINEVTAELYVNTDASTIGNIYAYTNNTTAAKVSTGSFPDYKCAVDGGTDYWVPNGMEGASFYFEDETVYKTTVAALVEDGNLKIGFRDATLTASQWTIFDNFRLYYYGSDKLVYYKQYLPQLKSEATDDLANGAYDNVIGSERSDFQTVLSAIPASETEAAYKTVIDNIVEKRTAFRTAATAYDAFVAAKATEYENNLPYASATKFAAIATAQAAADATSAADATAKTAAIVSAYRKYVESNALAEGVTGAEAIVISDPNMDVTYNSETHKFGAWQVIGQTNGTIDLFSSESFTDGDGKNDYKYANIYKSDNNAGIQQTVNLEAGTYILTVTARAKNTAGAAFWVFAGDKKQSIERIGNTGGVFDRGWNDCTLEFEVPEKSDVNIGVQSGNGKDLWWSATRFRLMKIKEGANMKITDAKWATFVAPFDVTIPNGVTAYKITGVSGTSLVKEVVETTIPANKPVLLNSESEVNQTFYGKAIADTPTNGLLTGVYVDNTPATVGTYVLEKHGTAVNFYKVEGAGIVINANRAYLTVPASVKMFSLDEDEEPTAIEGIDIAAEEYDAIYTPTGVKVESLQKGLNIVVKGEKSYKIFVK